MAILGGVALHELGVAADLSTRARAATAAVELLRDANSRNFESDRFQHLALHSHDAAGVKENTAEAMTVLTEASGAYADWSHKGTTALERSEAVKQVQVIAKIRVGRERILRWAAANPGVPVTHAIDKAIDRTEALVDSSDELNDTMVTAQQRSNDQLAKDAQASESRSRKLILALLLAGVFAGIAIALAMARSVTRPVTALLERLRRLQAEDVRSLQSASRSPARRGSPRRTASAPPRR
jgi:nitrogen fixation/metabolism regulation signal transduction histidine kinase